MPFPSTPLGTIVQLKINNVWTSVVRYDNNTKILNESSITIDKGASGIQQRTPPSICRWTWQDLNGIFNNDNPRSPYYQLLPRNTPVRVYVPRTQAALLVTPVYNTFGIRCSVPSSATLDILGDIDLRIEIEPKRWTRWGKRNINTAQAGGMILISKTIYTFSLQENGTLRFLWQDAALNVRTAISTARIDYTIPRQAFRVILDVDNGAGQYTVTFATASTIGGTYTTFGSVITGTTGVTNIITSGNAIEVGSSFGGADPSTIIQNGVNFAGRIYAAEIRNAIGGASVATANFTGRANGTTSFADGLGNTWTIGTNCEITNADYRFHGELSSPVTKPKRSKNGVGLDVVTEAEAGGIIRRLSTNDTPLQSPIYRALASTSFAPYSYWTGEGASTSDTSSAPSAITGVDAAVLQDITFNGRDTTLAGSAGVMVLGSTAPQFKGVCKNTALTTETHFIGYFKFPSIPVAEVVLFQIITANGTIVRWNFCVSNTSYILRGYNNAGTEIATKLTGFGAGASPTDWIAYHLQLTTSGGNVNILSEWMSVTSGAAFTQNGIGTVSYAGVNSIITGININGTGLSNVRVAHLMASTKVGLIFYDGVSNTFARFSAGYTGETADARFARICLLLGVTPVIWGALGDSEQMGAEPIDTGINILYKCVEVGGGVMLEAVDLPNTLEYHTLKSICNQQGTLSVTWAQLAEGLISTPDDTDVANDITLTRTNGGMARATLNFGPMSTQAPPNGINVVPDGPEINSFSDIRLSEIAQWLLLLRTWPTARYPRISIKLEHPTFTGNSTLALLAQRQAQPMRLTITNLPTFMPPDTLELLVKGVHETIRGQEWRIDFDCIPYGPYINGESLTTGPFTFKAAHYTVDGVVQQQLNAGITAGATSFAVKTLSGVLFDTTATNVPVKIGGELMTVGSITGTTSPQTFNSVTRGVNGYSAAHNANDPVIIYPTLKARL